MLKHHDCLMEKSCFSLNQNKLISLVIIVFGICSFAFSQLQTEDDNFPENPAEGVKVLDEIFNEIDRKIMLLRSEMNIPVTETLSKDADSVELSKTLNQVSGNLDSLYQDLTQSKGIFNELKNSKGGNLADSKPVLRSLFKKSQKTLSELEANQKLLEIALDDFSKLNISETLLNETAKDSTQTTPYFSQSRISKVINANEAIALTPSPRYSPETQKLQKEVLQASKNIQNLANNLNESENLTENLKRDNQFLSQSVNSGDSGVAVVRSAFDRLRGDLQRSKNNLTSTKQKMLDEQSRSTALIKSITNELERSREELAATKDLAAKAQQESIKLDDVEKKLVLVQKKINAAIASDEPQSLSELPEVINSIMIDIENTKRGTSSEEISDEDSKESISTDEAKTNNNELVNKLLIDLNNAKSDALEAKNQNRETRKALNSTVANLEDRLKATNIELSLANQRFQELNEEMAKREFEFADTIKQLEEEAQVAQKALSDASRGKLPAVPFIEEMERNLAESEERVQALSKQFDSEKEQASEVISGLQIELENALIRQKRAMDQLGRREVELQGRNQELSQLRADKKILEEELQVVKVLSSQLQDLNNVLEQTKEAQNFQSSNTDQVVASLRDELNKAKVELTFEKEENERLLKASSAKTKSLEGQLQLLREKLIEEQENLSRQSVESKDLIIDLKSELDQAREEINRMRSVGATDSLETKQAVSQLQEALGTIRILKESLEQSEQANLELDNLRAEIADSMAKQISMMKINEEDRKKLTDKIADLEAEILIFRDRDASNGLSSKQLVASLNENLKDSKLEISILKEALEGTEGLSIRNLIEMQDELATEETKNQELISRISELEEELLRENRRIEALESVSGKKSETINSETQELSAMISGLELKLNESTREIDRLKIALREADENGVENLISLDDELATEESKNQVLSSQIGLLVSEVKDLELKLNDSTLEIDRLKIGLRQAEENGMKNLVSLQDELALEESKNQDLNSRIEELDKEIRELKVSIESTEDTFQNNKLTESIIRELETSLSLAESSIVNLGDELNQSKIEKNELEERTNLVIKELEESVEEAEDKIASYENELNRLIEENIASNDRDLELSESIIRDLESSLAKAENTIISLQDQLASRPLPSAVANPEVAKKDNTPIKLEGYDSAGIKKLEEELMSAQLKLEVLENRNLEEKEARLLIQTRLEDLIASSENEIKPSVESNASNLIKTIEGYKIQLLEKDQNLADLEVQLTDSVAELAEREAELELIRAMTETTSQDSNESEIIKDLQLELSNLKSELASAKLADSTKEPNDDLKSQLEEAIADSFELQAQLEETQKRLAILEDSQNPSEELISEYVSIIEKAQENERKAIEEIDNLTDALVNSEQLRKELEALLDEFQQMGTKNEDIASDPKVLELQKELALLQEGLRVAKTFKDPEVEVLENELLVSKEETADLKEDFKNAMRDFVRLRNEVELIEKDNQRLRNQNLADAKSDADRQIISLKNQVAGLEDQNSLLRLDLDGRDRRIEDLKNQMVETQSRPLASSFGTQDSGQLRAQIIGLESSLNASRDAQNKAQMNADRLNLELQQSRQREANLEASLRNAMAGNRVLSAPDQTKSVSGLSANLSNVQMIELENLKEQNKRLQDQLASASTNADRDLLEQRIRDLNQRNLTSQVQLDQERKRSKDLERELEEAKNIKRGILEKGESASLKAELLNEELSNARNRISSLEKALIAAREAIRVLRNGGNNNSMINVSLNNPTSIPSSSLGLARGASLSSGNASPPRGNLSSRYNSSFSSAGNNRFDSMRSPQVTQVPTGNSSLNLKVEVQFLNNRNRPSSFTEFFLVPGGLNQTLEDARVRIPVNEGIETYGELWARSKQRGYRFPGIAANIRNALATTSLSRLKTNSVGEAKLQNMKPGRYFIVGASTLGQVGVVWSKLVDIKSGPNNIKLGLSDAIWAE